MQDLDSVNKCWRRQNAGIDDDQLIIISLRRLMLLFCLCVYSLCVFVFCNIYRILYFGDSQGGLASH